jgi:hypothetical protein
MPYSTDCVLTTHVGSLIRPPKLIEFLRLIEDGKPYDEASFEACLTESVTEVVRQQADVGIDIVSDGEFSKGLNWAFYIFKRLNGITVRPATPEELKDPMASMYGGQDRRAFPEFYAEYDTATGLGKRLSYRVVVNEPICYSGQGQVGRDIKNITTGLTMAKRQYPTLVGFLPVVAPASALPGAKIDTTRTRRRTCSRSPKLCTRNTGRSLMPAFFSAYLKQALTWNRKSSSLRVPRSRSDCTRRNSGRLCGSQAAVDYFHSPQSVCRKCSTGIQTSSFSSLLRRPVADDRSFVL